MRRTVLYLSLATQNSNHTDPIVSRKVLSASKNLQGLPNLEGFVQILSGEIDNVIST